MKVLLLYSSRDGQTRAIALYMANVLQDFAICDVMDLLRADYIDLSQYQGIIIGASVHYGNFNPLLFKFINQHTEQLNHMQSAFFAVNLTARKPEKRSPQTNVYVRKFLLKISWKPQACAVFAGALRYPHYKWFDKVMIKFIMWITDGETNTSKEVEYTDWQQVADFAKSFTKLQ